MKQYDINTINQYVADGKLMCQSHPTLPLKIYKYTVDTQFGKQWDDITLAARGLVLDDQGYAYTNSIGKFFNIEELPALGIELPNEPYEIFDKVDGSCIEVFRYNGELIVCTLGSFESEQAKMAKEMLNAKYIYYLGNIKDGETWIMEILHPQNRIVLDYGNESKLVLLAIRTDSSEYPYYAMGYVWPDVVEKIDTTLEQLLVEKSRPDFTNKEGFVIKFASGFRVKVKYEEYFRLHKIMTGVNERFIWEFLKENKPLPLENVPDEFFQYVTEVRDRLEMKFENTLDEAEKAFNDICVHGETRKEFALKAIQSPYRAILFKMLEGKPYVEIIWDMIKPESTVTKFSSLKKNEEES
jgi:RNA ligase